MTEQTFTTPDTTTTQEITQPVDWQQYIYQDSQEMDYPLPDFTEQQQQWDTTAATEGTQTLGDMYIPPWLQGFVNFVNTYSEGSSSVTGQTVTIPDYSLSTGPTATAPTSTTAPSTTDTGTVSVQPVP